MAPKLSALLSALLLTAGSAHAQGGKLQVDLDSPGEHRHPHRHRHLPSRLSEAAAGANR
jgi:hypothetical protein